MGKEKQTDYDLPEVEKIPAELVERLKAKYGDKLRNTVVQLDEYGNRELEVALCVPSRKVMGQAQKFMDTNMVKAFEILIKACCLTSKERVLNDDALFFTVAGDIASLFPIRESRLGKF